MVRSSVSQRVDIEVVPLLNHTKKLYKILFTAPLLDAQRGKDDVKKNLASSFVVPLGRALNGIHTSLCGS